MIVAIVQARMGSTRLPGKVLMDIQGKPLLEHVLGRVSLSRLIGKIVIATTENKEDEAILDFAEKRGFPHYTGSQEDVLDRFYQTARRFGATVIVRITPDDPFKDPQVIDRITACYLEHEGGIDYVSNTLKPTYPEGLDIEVFSFAALEKAWKEAKKPSEREHVTPYIWSHPELFHLLNVENSEDLSSMRWTIDTEADLRFAREVYARLYHGSVFLTQDILALLKVEPELMKINTGTVRNAGYLTSVKQDENEISSESELEK